MVKSLVVDDGVAAKGHRQQVLEPSYTHIGVSCGCHSYYGDVCCVLYGQDVAPKQNVVARDVLRVNTHEECEKSARLSDALTGQTRAVTLWKSLRDQPIDSHGVPLFKEYHDFQANERANDWDGGKSSLRSESGPSNGQVTAGTQSFNARASAGSVDINSNSNTAFGSPSSLTAARAGNMNGGISTMNGGNTQGVHGSVDLQHGESDLIIPGLEATQHKVHQKEADLIKKASLKPSPAEKEVKVDAPSFDPKDLGAGQFKILPHGIIKFEQNTVSDATGTNTKLPPIKIDDRDPSMAPIKTGSSKTYEEVSKQFFNEMQALMRNP